MWEPRGRAPWPVPGIRDALAPFAVPAHPRRPWEGSARAAWACSAIGAPMSQLAKLGEQTENPGSATGLLRDHRGPHPRCAEPRPRGVAPWGPQRRGLGVRWRAQPTLASQGLAAEPGARTRRLPAAALGCGK